MISARYSRILNTSDVPFDEDLEYEIEGNSSKQQRDRGPITSSTVFHSLKFKAMQDVHLCMYVCMYVCMHVCMYMFHKVTFD